MRCPLRLWHLDPRQEPFCRLRQLSQVRVKIGLSARSKLEEPKKLSAEAKAYMGAVRITLEHLPMNPANFMPSRHAYTQPGKETPCSRWGALDMSDFQEAQQHKQPGEYAQHQPATGSLCRALEDQEREDRASRDEVNKD
ncbi:protein of unknown function [Candidatus Filomicrobium marinum]|nr:protein of unknown function [Candidatus Filomicrobium marinum]